MQKIILASQSPRRKQLLEWADVPFEIITRHTDENYPADLPIIKVPEYIALQKALAVRDFLQMQTATFNAAVPIVAADTVVVYNNNLIGKPLDRQRAIETLQQLAGQHHKVITGVVILRQQETISFSETTDVSFHPLTIPQIEYYVDKYQPYDKAGAYAIQEWIGVVGIASITGDFYNVMGLPVSRVVRELGPLNPPKGEF